MYIVMAMYDADMPDEDLRGYLRRLGIKAQFSSLRSTR
jgi:hypothetical protein